MTRPHVFYTYTYTCIQSGTDITRSGICLPAKLLLRDSFSALLLVATMHAIERLSVLGVGAWRRRRAVLLGLVG